MGLVLVGPGVALVTGEGQFEPPVTVVGGAGGGLGDAEGPAVAALLERAVGDAGSDSEGGKKGGGEQRAEPARYWVLRMMWYPNGVSTTPVVCPTFSLKAASEN